MRIVADPDDKRDRDFLDDQVDAYDDTSDDVRKDQNSKVCASESLANRQFADAVKLIRFSPCLFLLFAEALNVAGIGHFLALFLKCCILNILNHSGLLEFTFGLHLRQVSAIDGRVLQNRID